MSQLENCLWNLLQTIVTLRTINALELNVVSLKAIIYYELLKSYGRMNDINEAANQTKWRLRKKDYLRAKKLDKWFYFITSLQQLSRNLQLELGTFAGCELFYRSGSFWLPVVQIDAIMHQIWIFVKIGRWLFRR